MSARRPKQKPIEFEELVARAIRPPTLRDPRWYWRANLRGGERPTIWCGRATRDALKAILVRMLADGIPEEALARLGRHREILTIQDLLEVWLGGRDGETGLAPRTRTCNRSSALRIVRTIGPMALARLSIATLERMRDLELQAGYSTGTVNADWRTLKAAIRWGQELAPPLVDPHLVIRRPHLTHRPVREAYIPTPEEVDQLLASLRGWQRICVLLWVETGARRDEIAALPWGDVDLRGRWVGLPGSRTKTGQTRKVPLRAEVASELRAWRLQTPGPLVVGRSPESIRHLGWLTSACQAAGVPRVTPQSFRRYREQELCRAGVGVHTFAAWMGHTPAVALRHYLRPGDEDLLAALAKTARSDESPAAGLEGR